jgi:hypothetical protein
VKNSPEMDLGEQKGVWSRDIRPGYGCRQGLEMLMTGWVVRNDEMSKFERWEVGVGVWRGMESPRRVREQEMSTQP